MSHYKLPLLKGYWGYAFLMYIAMLVKMVVPLCYAYMVDRIIMPQNYDLLLPWALVTIAIAVSAAILEFYFYEFLTTKKDIEGSAEICKLSLRNLLGFSIPKFEEFDKSYYFNVITNSSYTYGSIKAQLTLQLPACILIVLTILAISFSINSLLTVFMILAIPCIIFSTQLQGKKLAAMQQDILEKQDNVLKNMRYIIDSKREIQSVRKEPYFTEAFNKEQDQWTKFITRFQFYHTLNNQLPSIVFGILSVCFLFLGGLLLKQGRVTEGLLLAGFQYLISSHSPLLKLHLSCFALNLQDQI